MDKAPLGWYSPIMNKTIIVQPGEGRTPLKRQSNVPYKTGEEVILDRAVARKLMRGDLVEMKKSKSKTKKKAITPSTED